MRTKIAKKQVQINGYLPPQSIVEAGHACLMVGCSASLRPPKNKNFLHSASLAPQIPFKTPKKSAITTKH